MTTIAVLGPGGVGGFVAAALARAGEDVLVIAREDTASVIAERGIEVRSVRLGDFKAGPRVGTELTEAVDLLIVATKATTLASALERVKEPPGLILPMLNGLDHVAALRSRYGAGRVAAAPIRIEADRPRPGVIVQTSPFLRVDVAHDDPARRQAVEQAAATLEQAGIPATSDLSEAQALWSKLVRLNALACTTSATDKPVGFIRNDPEWRATLIACIEEASLCANAEGAESDPATAVAELDAAHEGLGSSMQRDIAAGRTPELDAIPGAVLRAGARNGIPCPTIEWLSRAVAAKAGIEPPTAGS